MSLHRLSLCSPVLTAFAAVLIAACAAPANIESETAESAITSVDGQFGTNGFVVTDLGSKAAAGGNDTARAIVRLSNGKLLVGADAQPSYASFAAARNASGFVAYLRYNADGTLDTTYGSPAGWAGALGPVKPGVTTPFGESVGKVTQFLRASSGRIVSVGAAGDERARLGPWCQGACNPGDFAIAAFSPDGSVDTSFGSSGRTLVDFEAAQDAGGSKHTLDGAVGAVIQSGDRVLVGGTSELGLADRSPTFALARLTASGQLDASFVNSRGGDKPGLIRLPRIGANGARAAAVTTAPNDGIVLAGYTTQATQVVDRIESQLVLARFDADGALVQAFGQGGIVLADLGAVATTATAVLAQGDGTLLVGGQTGKDLFLARFDANGALDPTFGDAGVVRFRPAGADSASLKKLVATPSRVYALGEARKSSATAPIVIRLDGNATGAFDAAFGDDGVFSGFAGAPGPASLLDLAPLPDGSLVAVGGVRAPGANGRVDSDIVLTRLHP